MEYDAIKLLIKLLNEDKTPAAPGFTLHVAHLANAEALPMIEAARKKGASLLAVLCRLQRATHTDNNQLCNAKNAPSLLYIYAEVFRGLERAETV